MKRIGQFLIFVILLSCNQTVKQEEKVKDDYQPAYDEGFFYEGYKHYTLTPPKFATSNGDEVLFELNKHKGNAKSIQDDEYVQEIRFSLPNSKSFKITEKDSISISYQYVCFCFTDSTFKYPTIERFQITGQHINDSIWDIAGIVLINTDTILFNEKFKLSKSKPTNYVNQLKLAEIMSWAKEQ